MEKEIAQWNNQDLDPVRHLVLLQSPHIPLQVMILYTSTEADQYSEYDCVSMPSKLVFGEPFVIPLLELGLTLSLIWINFSIVRDLLVVHKTLVGTVFYFKEISKSEDCVIKDLRQD
jgi:hypothetical protein